MAQNPNAPGRAPDLSVQLGSLRLRNPVIAASGTFGYGAEYADFFDVSVLGAIAVKGISLRPRPGNPPPRLVETPAGLINAIGLENVGVDLFLAEKLPFLRERRVTVIVNIFGNQLEEFAELASRLDGAPGVAALELNVSCPNVKEGGMLFGTDPSVTRRVVETVRRRTSLPLITKLTPNVTRIADIARAAVDGGTDMISCINTVAAMAVDIYSRRPKLANVVGGLSGPAIRPIALRCVWEVVRAVKCPVIGLGGIASASDALEFLLVGARAVQVGTANFVRPDVAIEIIEGMDRFLRFQGLDSIEDYIGTLDMQCGFPFAEISCAMEMADL